jgi:hypothetical protein
MLRGVQPQRMFCLLFLMSSLIRMKGAGAIGLPGPQGLVHSRKGVQPTQTSPASLMSRNHNHSERAGVAGLSVREENAHYDTCPLLPPHPM